MRWVTVGGFRGVAGVGAVALLASLALLAAANPASPAPAARPDAGVSAGGHTLLDPARPNVEANRARFELAVRESQATGAIRGKSLTIRVKGFDNRLYVVRSNAVPVGGGANIASCSLTISPDGELATLTGNADVFVLVGGVETPSGRRFAFAMMLADLANPSGAGHDEILIVQETGAPLPFALPDGVLASGNVGMVEGPKAPAC